MASARPERLLSRYGEDGVTDSGTNTVYEPGDVVYGEDPFKGAGAARPWLVVSNHEGRPFHGDQYITLTLTTRTWPDGLLAIPEGNWTHGGTPAPSYIVPWGVQSLGNDDIDYWQGRLDRTLVDEAIGALTDYLG